MDHPAVLHVRRRLPEGVEPPLSGWHGVLQFILDDLAPQREHVVQHPRDGAAIGRFVSQEERLSDTKVVDAVRHPVVKHQRQAAGVAARHVLELVAAAVLRLLRQVRQLLQLLRRRDDAAVAVEVHAQPVELHAAHRQDLLHHRHDVLRQHSLAQVPQLHHQDDLVRPPQRQRGVR